MNEVAAATTTWALLYQADLTEVAHCTVVPLQLPAQHEQGPMTDCRY